MLTQPVITLDIDWAPDFIINNVADILIEHRVNATWFATHLSSAVRRLQEYNDLFEIGIHPNFMEGSTHGKTSIDVLKHMMDLFPEAKSMRSHGLVQSSSILAEVCEYTSIVTDVSLFLPSIPYSIYSEYWTPHRKLDRYTYVWEDNYEMFKPTAYWRYENTGRDDLKLGIINFHPVHLVLNGADLSNYKRLKDRKPRIDQVEPIDLQGLTSTGEGPRTMFDSLLHFPSCKISDISP
ncbi:conserved hypothetical protein [Candidatus Terasakiella magnetica]|uniref:Uncharacterized protein n=1 Tax=Candidatus Terasakiella magnetica TaxID=1867952 RepID=A0A1C3RG53_9PROT|nr:hypothetical protein [Candidatus Terasakiella magnetica]SCA56239.1 conserved hypothetical protein [Candidatus Terasakiella magnetica]